MKRLMRNDFLYHHLWIYWSLVTLYYDLVGIHSSEKSCYLSNEGFVVYGIAGIIAA